MTVRPVRRRALALALAVALGAFGCSSDDGGGAGGGDGTSATETTAPVDVAEVLSGLADDVIVPSYEQLEAALLALKADVAALCTTPSADTLEAARSAWRDAVVAWQGTRGAGVGPALDERLMSDVAFAARPRVIKLLLEGTDPVDPASLADEGAAGRGLYAAEEALFGDGSEALTSAAGSRRCEYAASVATLAADAAAPVVAEWTGGGARQALVDGLDGTPQSTIDAVVNELSHRLEEIDAMGLRDMALADGPDDLDDTRRGGAADFRVGDRAALLAEISAVGGLSPVGLTATTVITAFLHLGVAINLLPTTGLTLPFISYGRSNLILTMLMTGILVNIGSEHEKVIGDRATNPLETSPVRA